MTSVTALRGDTHFCREVSNDISLQALSEQFPERYPFFLQSTASEPKLGRFDILFATSGEQIVLEDFQTLHGSHAGGAGDDGIDFLTALDAWWRSCRSERVDSRLPFHGGWFVYLGYELAGQIEPSLELQADSQLPVAFAVRCPAALVREHESGKVYAVGESDSDILADMLADTENSPCSKRERHDVRIVATHEAEPGEFLSAVVAAKEYVAAGDVYQANLSRRWQIEIREDASAIDIYASLCESNPAPFAGLVRWRDSCIISSSPERLISVRDNVVSTRPIAGTRPRGASAVSDNALSDELFDHPKERAEHIMLIDLERNDLGRICEAGTVHVDEFMVLESYAHVHHIVSNVCGVLRDGVTPGDSIRAVFPGGTITGCPKVRCMQIINELEHLPRGAYTGSFGYLNLDGSMDLNILIRTMVMRGNEIELRAGSGIVADSDPQAELAETRAKAKGLLAAFGK